MKKKKKKRSSDSSSVPSVEELVKDITTLVQNMQEDIIQPRNFASEEIHLLVAKLKEISNVLVSHFYQDELELRKSLKTLRKYEEMFDQQKIEVNKIVTEMFPHSETVRRAFDMILGKFDTLFSEKFEDKEKRFEELTSPTSLKTLQVNDSPSKRKRRRSSSLVTPEKSRRVRNAESNVFVELHRVKEMNTELVEKNNFQEKRIRQLEIEITQKEVDNLISLSREDAQDELIRKFRTLQGKVKALETETWTKGDLIDELRKKVRKLESKIDVHKRLKSKFMLRKEVLQRVSQFESKRADIIKKQQTTIMSDSLIASVIDEQLSKVFETEESLIEEQRKRKKSEHENMTLEVELKREREHKEHLERTLDELRSQPPSIQSSEGISQKVKFHREEVEVDDGSRSEEYAQEADKVERLYQYQNDPYNNNIQRNRSLPKTKGECFSRGTMTHRVRWGESYVMYLYHLMNEMYFINLNQKPDYQFLVTFLKLFKAIRLIYRQMRLENTIELESREIRDLLPKAEDILRDLPSKQQQQRMSTSENHHHRNTSPILNNPSRIRRRKLRTAAGRRGNNSRGGLRTSTNSLKKIGNQKMRRPHTASYTMSGSNYNKSKSSGSSGRYNYASDFSTVPQRRPFQYYKSVKSSLKPIGKRSKRF